MRDKFKDIKYWLKQGNRVTVVYAELVSTGEIATTVRNFRQFKRVLKQLERENVKFHLRVESNKAALLRDIDRTLKNMHENALLIGDDNIWLDYHKELKNLVYELKYHI
jgi:hypothetical protein